MSGYNYGELSDIKPDMSKEFVFQKIEKNIYIYYLGHSNVPFLNFHERSWTISDVNRHS
jgi:hypothetical protein